MKRKFLSTILALAMVLTLLPVTALAEGNVAQIGNQSYETLEAAFDAVTGSTPTTIKVLADTQIASTLNVEIGENITLDLNGCAVTTVDGGTRTYAVTNDGTFTIKDSSQEQLGSISARGLFNDGTINMQGGTVSAIGDGGGAAIYNREAGAVVNMSGGVLEATGTIANGSASRAIVAPNGTTINVTGGTLRARYLAINSTGINEINLKDCTIEITGDQETSDYAVYALGGANVTMENVTIDSKLGAGCVQINGGTADITDCNFSQTGQGNPDYVSCAVAASNGAQVTIDGGTYGSDAQAAVYVYNSGATITVKGGTFNGDLKADNSNTSNPSVIKVEGGTFTGDYVVGDQSTLTISGGTFSQKPADTYLADGYVAVADSDSWTVKDTATIYVDPDKGNDNNTGAAGSDAVKTFANALQKVRENGTIAVMGDLNHEIKGITKPVTIKGIGDTPVHISGGVTLPQNVDYLKLENLKFDNEHSIIGNYDQSGNYSDLNLVIEKCTFDNADGNCVYIIPQISALTVNGCTFNASDAASYQKAYLIWPYATKTITITDNVFDGSEITRAPIHLGNGHPDGTIATVDGNTITGFERGVQLAFINDGPNTVTINDNTFEDVTLSDVTISAPMEVGTVYIHESQKDNTNVTYTNNKLTGETTRAITSEHLTLATSDVIKTFTGNTLNGQDLGSLAENSFSTCVAQIGEQKYTTLSKALEAAGTMSGDVIVTLLADVDVSNSAGRAFDLSKSALTSLTIRGVSQDVKLISGVNGNNIDGPTYCPVLTVKLPVEGTFTVENLTFPNDLLFDGAAENAVVVQNCVFNGSQSGYPKAKSISYLNNLFEFKGSAGSFYTNNAYPVWYKSERDQSIVFNGNTVKGYRGVHIETRANDASGHKVNIEVNNNRFELTDSEYENKEVALQLVRAVNGSVSFQNNYVDGYMAVCFFKGIQYFDGMTTIQNNYLVGDCKLYGSSEWNAEGATPEEKESNADSFAQTLVEALGTNGVVSEGHTHNYVNGVCTICGQSQPSTGGSGSSGSSGNKTETVTNPDGSTTTTVTKPDGSTTETTKNPDGSTEVVNTDKTGNVTTTTTDKTGNKTETVEKTDGTSQTTVTNKDGSSSTTIVDENGKTEAQVKLSDAVVNDAAGKGEAVTLPMPEVPATTDRETAPTITMDLPGGTSAKVEIPVAEVTPGTVAVIVKADGTEEVIKTSLTTETGVVVTLSDGDTVKIVDNSKTFDDVTDNYWGAEAVDFAASRELFAGTSATTFAPETSMTRAMIVTVLARLEDVDTDAGSTWYEAGQQWAMENGISDGTNMDASLTREQLASMLWRYAGSPSVSNDLSGYTDADAVSAWADDAMAWCVEQGIISGTTTTTLGPQGEATRVQVAAILMRFLQAGA